MRSVIEKAIKLRRDGKTYSEIGNILGISKSTLSYWLSSIELTDDQRKKIDQNINKKLMFARQRSVEGYKKKREEYFADIKNRNERFVEILDTNKNTAKLVLSALHLGEGAKNRRGSIQFGNSDPGIIKLFMKLMRECYLIDETKFRCTILCRSDQNINKLEKFWQRLTHISKKRFYKTRIDTRTIGRPSRKLDYKGVCVINYLSASVYYDLLTLGKMMSV